MILQILWVRVRMIKQKQSPEYLTSRDLSIKVVAINTIQSALKLTCNIFRMKNDLEKRNLFGICKVSCRHKNHKFPKTIKLDLIAHFVVHPQHPVPDRQEKCCRGLRPSEIQLKTFKARKESLARLVLQILKKVTQVDLFCLKRTKNIFHVRVKAVLTNKS